MQDDPEREQDEDEEDEEKPKRKRAYARRRFVTRGGELVEVSASPVRETR